MQSILTFFGKLRYYLRIFKPVFKHLKNALPVLLFLGFILSLLAIWWLGPQLQWRESYPMSGLMPKILATLVVLLSAAVGFGVLMRKRLKNAEQTRLDAEEQDPLTPYIEAQAGRLAGIVESLKENLGAKDYLYKMPWYLVLGGEGSGKTSLVNRSAQHFSFSTATKAAEIGGRDGVRRRCDAIDMPYDIDWWFGNEAILIAPDGGLVERRTLDNDPKKVELARGLWRHFVDWMSKVRPRRPLNGVVLVIDLARVVNQTPSERKAYAGLLRARLRELMETLGSRLPVYVVLTKFDLIKGFDAYFHSVKKTEREQTFGVTFELQGGRDADPDQWLYELNGWYSRLLGAMNDHLLDRMATTTVVEDRENLFVFVRQLAGLKDNLQDFLAEVLESDRFSTPALVRGLYFSSVFQQGIPVNPFIDASAKSYRVPMPVSAALPSTQSLTYFVKYLFSEIVYPEAGLATDNAKVVKQKQTVTRVAAAVAGLFAVLMLFGLQRNYEENVTAVHSVLTAVEQYQGQVIVERIDETGKNLLPALNQARNASMAFVDYRDRFPWLADLGLYQGWTLGPEAEKIYQGFLSQRFLPALATGVAERINAAAYASDEKLMGLRVYRMIEDLEHRQKPIVTDWMDELWSERLGAEVDVQDQLMTHLDYAMDRVDTQLPRLEPWVKATQQELLTIPLPDRVYRAMKRNASVQFAAALDLRTEVGPAFDVVYEHEREQSSRNDARQRAKVAPGVVKPLDEDTDYFIEAFLTRAGFRDHFVDENEKVVDLAMLDSWVLGLRNDLQFGEDEKRVLRNQVRELYVADYINTWNRGLRKLQVNDFDNLAHAVKVLDSLSGPSTPLQRLMKSVESNSNIYPKAAKEHKALDQVLQQDPNRKAALQIQRAFVRLTELLKSKVDQPPYVDEVMQTMTVLHDYMREIKEASHPGKRALMVAQDRFALRGSDPISILHRLANGLPEPLDRQLNKVANESWRVVLVEALRELERKWDKEVYDFYESRLKHHYPLNAKGKDASLEDFSRFFSPGGLLDSFNKEYLSLFMQSDMDILKSDGRHAALINRELVEQLQRAEHIRDAYFNSAGALQVPFTIEPLALSGSQRKSVLNIDGQIISYSHGPAYAVDMLWPNTLQSRTESKLVLVSSSGKNARRRAQGAWSLFRLLDRGHHRAASNNSTVVSFGLNKGVMRYRLRGAGDRNPLNNDPLAGFSLSRFLLDESQAPQRVSEHVPASDRRRL